MIVKAAPLADGSAWFTQVKDLAPSTWNKRLGYLKRCLDWAVSQGKVARNPYQDINSRKATKAALQPLSVDEIGRILAKLREDYPGSYYPFSAFLLATGVRTSEAIGLRWGDIDLERGTVTISSSLSRDRTGTGHARKRKTTKTGNVRTLTLSAPLAQLLLNLSPGAVDALVFHSPGGAIISDSNFRTVWKLTLDALGIPYRKPYISRHSTASHALDQGASVMDVARLLGHTDGRMVTQTYGHSIKPPSLPELPIGGDRP